ncbi:MAG: NAD(P)/FAD-dependent oxidoreductase, partial [Bauldia sp.]|nr:NAD(P)/FAD-dependent oxidoreductase [Bauldia sp.]
MKPGNWLVESETTTSDGTTEAWITFETGVARGIGHVRLEGDHCVTLLTTVTELKGHEERRGATREKGVEHGAFKH